MTPTNTYTLHVFEDKRGEWRWTIHHANGNKIATGGKGYSTRSNAIRAARRLKVIAGSAKLIG
jgi:uncharacterized protein YegP (UPF0339 family)